MEFDQKEETPFNIPEKNKTNKKTLAIYIGAGLITISSLIYSYASYQATYFKDLENIVRLENKILFFDYWS